MRYLRRWGQLIAFVVIVVAMGWILSGVVDSLKENTLASCERGNDSRVGQLHLYNDLVEINRRRVRAASSPAEARANLYAKNQYQADKQQFVRAQKEFAIHPGSVRIDCQAAFR